MWQATFSFSDFGLRKQMTFCDDENWDQDQFSSLFVNEILAEKGLRDPLRENVWKLLNWTSSRVAKQPVVSLRNNVWETSAGDDAHYPDLGRAFERLEICFTQLEAPPRFR